MRFFSSQKLEVYYGDLSDFKTESQKIFRENDSVEKISFTAKECRDNFLTAKAIFSGGNVPSKNVTTRPSKHVLKAVKNENSEKC